MRYIEFGSKKTRLSELVVGMMRITSLSDEMLEHLIDRALDLGINAFDLADCYGDGACEAMVGRVLKKRPDLRERMWIQSKCGIVRDGNVKVFDFSKTHILEATEGILSRLQTDHIDSLLLHRPDALMEPEEIAEAVTKLKQDGKIIDFGVSNMNPMMMELLKTSVKDRICVNQVQLSAAFCPAIDHGLHVNMTTPEGTNRDGSVLEYCRIHDMVIQAWSSLQYGFFEGVFIGNDKFPELNAVLDRIAGEKGVSSSAVAIAWILRYPGKMQAVVGTTKEKRIEEMAKACDISLSRRECYEIYASAGKVLP